MRINRFLALAIGVSRRAADKLADEGQIMVNGRVVRAGHVVEPGDKVTYDNKLLSLPETITIMLNKPAGYVVSRTGQGSKTIYDLLPTKYHSLKPIGRLDKNSSGLLLLTNDGQLAQELTHPKFAKEKLYEIELDKPLTSDDKTKIERGIKVDDYISRLRLSNIGNWKLKNENCSWRVAMSQGRNRQIRRTFAALGYEVTKLHRTRFGKYELGNLKSGEFRKL